MTWRPTFVRRPFPEAYTILGRGTVTAAWQELATFTPGSLASIDRDWK
jgi:hypothetical protein